MNVILMAIRRFRKIAKKVVRKGKAKAKTTIPKMIMSKIKQLERTRETKCLQFYSGSTPLSAYNIGAYGGVANTMTVIPLGPNSLTLPIPQGAGQGQRVGNIIETTKASIRMMFFPAFYNVENNPSPIPQIVKIWGLWYKLGDYTGAPPASLEDMFQSGNTSIDPTGVLLDDFLTVNKDAYTVAFTRTFKVGNQSMTGNTNASNGIYLNNDFKMNAKCTIDYTKHLIKQQKFNDTNTEPSNRQLYLVVESLNPAGGAGIGYPTIMTYEIDYRYKDA
jgi:hypothetical protein